MSTDEFDWLDVQPGTGSVVGQGRIDQIRNHPLGKDKAWHCDGEYIWLRREKANPATLERHDRFVGNGDYKHIETQDGVEVWELQESSPFKQRSVNLSEMDNYNVRRQAALAAVRRDWETFQDIMSYLRDRIIGNFGAHRDQGELVYAETYAAVMSSVAMRNGPSPQEINQELMALMQRKNVQRDKIISFGGQS